MKIDQTKSIGTSMFSARCWMLNVALGLLLATAGSALADVRYVDVNSTNAAGVGPLFYRVGVEELTSP